MRVTVQLLADASGISAERARDIAYAAGGYDAATDTVDGRTARELFRSRRALEETLWPRPASPSTHDEVAGAQLTRVPDRIEPVLGWRALAAFSGRRWKRSSSPSQDACIGVLCGEHDEVRELARGPPPRTS